jgi:hypothetical protein
VLHVFIGGLGISIDCGIAVINIFGKEHDVPRNCFIMFVSEAYGSMA